MQMLEGTEYLTCTKEMIRPPSIIALRNNSAETRGADTPRLLRFCTVCKRIQFCLFCAKERINSELENMNKDVII